VGLTERIDRFQRRHTAVGYPLAVVYKFFDDQGVYLAVVITYYAFVSVVPLLLLATSVLGFLLQDDPEPIRAAAPLVAPAVERVVLTCLPAPPYPAAGGSRRAGHPPRRASRSHANGAGDDRLPRFLRECAFFLSETSWDGAGVPSCSNGCPG